MHLASAALDAGVTLWKCRPKLHDLEEQIDRLAHDRYNLLYHQCVHDESMLGTFKIVTRACHPSSAHLRMAQRCLSLMARAFGKL